MYKMYLFFCVAFIVISCCYSGGEYWPGAYYTIDKNGNKADTVFLNKDTIWRFRRNAANAGSFGGSFGNGGYGGGYSSGGGYGGAYSGQGYGSDIVFDGPTSDVAKMVQSGLDDTFNQLKSLAGGAAFPGGGVGGAAFPGGGVGGGRSYSGSFSSGGPPKQGGVLHSRFASSDDGYENEYVTGDNYGIRSSSSAQGPHGAFSFSSSSTDEDGRVHYQSRAHKF